MKNGPYEMVVAPDDYPGKKYRGKYCYEHHLVWWKVTGRMVRSDHIIHHVNGKKRDNRFENLEEMSRSKHTADHNKERSSNLIRLRCGWCSETMEMKPHKYRERMKASATGNLFCSRSCGAKHQHSRVV